MARARQAITPAPSPSGGTRRRQLLFVYGTLRRGAPGVARHLLSGRADYLDAGAYQGKLYDLGAYPALTPSLDVGDRVVGDVFALRGPRRLLSRLDSYEGHDYCRQIGIVETAKHGRLRAWVYHYPGALAGRSRIESGDYVAHLRRNPASRQAASWSRMV